MTFFEGIVLLALVGGATKVIMVALEAVRPSVTRQNAILEERWTDGHARYVAGELDDAAKRWREVVRQADEWFGEANLHSARAWLHLAAVAHAREDFDAMEASARAAMGAAEGVEDGAWYSARSREDLARALTFAGRSGAAATLLDDAQSIRIEWDHTTVAENLEVRAELAAHQGDFANAVRLYERLVAAVDELPDVQGGPYRAPPTSPRERPPFPGYWVENALTELARVCLLDGRDEVGLRVLQRLVTRIRAMPPSTEWSRGERLVRHAARLMEYELVEPAAELATQAVGLTGPGARAALALYATDLRQHSSRCRAAEAPLAADGRPLDAEGAELCAQILYDRGEHERGDALFEAAGGPLAPDHSEGVLRARASSLFARGERADAEGLAAEALPRVSRFERVLWAHWCVDRRLTTLADQFCQGLGDPLESLVEEHSRRMLLALRAAYQGEFDRAAALAADLPVPPRFPAARSWLGHQLAFVVMTRGRRAAARRHFASALASAPRAAAIRHSLYLYCDAAEARGFPAEDSETAAYRRARQIGDELLPARDRSRARWLRYEAYRLVNAGDAEAALERADALRELLDFWFGDATPERPRLSAVYAAVFDALGRHEDAVTASREALTDLEQQLPADHPTIAEARVELAMRLPEGERRALLEPALATLRAHGADAIDEVAAALAALGPI